MPMHTPPYRRFATQKTLHNFVRLSSKQGIGHKGLLDLPNYKQLNSSPAWWKMDKK